MLEGASPINVASRHFALLLVWGTPTLGTHFTNNKATGNRNLDIVFHGAESLEIVCRRSDASKDKNHWIGHTGKRYSDLFHKFHADIHNNCGEMVRNERRFFEC